MLRLRTFGGLSIESEAGALTGAATQRKPLALLALLAAAGRSGKSRDEILLHLWPDSTPERARNVLKQTVYALRRDLKAPELLSSNGEIRLNPSVLTSDVMEFESALAHGELQQATELYGGPFLDGFHLRESPEFERWREGERARLARRFMAAVESLAVQAAQAGEHQRAVELWRRLATPDPLDSHAALGLMNALIAVGDRAAAIQHARVYETLVRGELSREPDHSVIAAAEELRQAMARPSGPNPLVPEEAAPTRAVTALPPRAQPKGEAKPAITGLPRWRTLAWWLPAAALIGVLALAAVLRIAHHRYARDLDPNLIVIAPYRVLDPELHLWHEGLVDVLSRDLDGAGMLRTVAPGVAVRQWHGGHPDPQSARELGWRTGAGLAIAGSLLRAGRDSVRVTATVVDAVTGSVVGEVERRDAIVRMDRLTDSLTLAVLRELEQEHRTGISSPASVTLTSSAMSLGALKAFLRGEQFYRRSRWDSARVYYERAITQDTAFPLALRHLGNVLAWQRLTVDSLSLSFLLRAGAINHGLNPRDSFLVAADSLLAAANLSHSTVERWHHTRRLFSTLEEAASRYPDAPGVWLALGEARYHFGAGPVIGVPEQEVLAAFDRAIGLDPTFAPAYIHPVELGFNLGGRALGLRYARRYLALNPEEPAHRGVRLVLRLTNSSQGMEAEVERLLDTVATEALVSARTILRRWPDSAETAVRLSRLLAAGRPSAYPLFSDTSFMRLRLAEQLAFRGHLGEAYRLLGTRELPIFAELAYLGAVPAETAAAAFGRWTREGSRYARLALPWWSAQGDTTAIVAFRRRAALLSTVGSTEDERLAGAYDTAASGAYLLLARRDSAEALRWFLALPDTLCPECYVDRLVRARLLSRRGRHREALAGLQEQLMAFLTPLEVEFALERGRLVEQLKDRTQAVHAYRFVADAWAHADPELQPQAAEARAGLKRLSMDDLGSTHP